MLASNVCDQEREFEEKLVLIQRFGVPAEIDGVRIDPMGVGPYGSSGSKAPAREEGGSGLPFCSGSLLQAPEPPARIQPGQHQRVHGPLPARLCDGAMEKWLKAGPGGRYLGTRPVPEGPDEAGPSS